MKAASIEFRRVSKHYSDVAAVNDISFTIAPSTLVTLLGPSGCGKTTTLRMIAGLETPTSGTILVGDVDVTSQPASERDVSMVFQSYALFPHMSVLENVRYGLVVSGVRKPRADERARETLETVGLAGLDARLPSELSGGQQQRVAVARALVLEPSVLLFDEPLSNLDARLRRQMREEIRDLQQRLGLTVVYVTHDQSEALAVSDRIIVMNKAVIAQEGTPRELYEAPRDPFVAGFMGDANRIRATLARRGATLADVRIGPITLNLPHRGLADGDVDIAVRPESIVLSRETAESAIRATVSKAAYLGGFMEYTLATEVGDLFVVTHDVDMPYTVGDTIGAVLAAHGAVVIPRAT
jgi:iron(III) transport system ATP-binding protein